MQENKQRQQLQDLGYVILKGWYKPQEAQEIKENCQNLFSYPDTGVEVYMAEQCPQWYLGACIETRLATELQDLGITDPEFLSVKTVIKDATRNFASPWHQDRPYWGGVEKYSLWVALDDCTINNGCLRIIPGTHKQGEWQHDKHQEMKFGNRLAEVDESLAEDVLLNKGDALLFHDCLVHASHPNLSGKDRWSMIATYRSSKLEDDSQVWEHPCAMSA